MIKVLVVDDSTLMVKLLSEIINRDSELRVIGTAFNGYEAVRKVQALSPDVITMDVYMPLMDGLTAVEQIMSTNPTPIVMISSLTQEGAAATIKALNLGAIDFIPKPSGYISLDIEALSDEIIAKVKLAAKIRVVRTVKHFAPLSPDEIDRKKGISRRFGSSGPALYPCDSEQKEEDKYEKVVAIGCSTGGPAALSEILQKLPATFPAPIFVVQHMPKKFTAKLAEGLDQQIALHVIEAKEGMEVRCGTVYIAPGAYHMRIRTNRLIALEKDESPSIPRPSVDILMKSVAEVYGKNAIGVILTGMGNDGVIGMNAIKRVNGITIAQDEETSLVFGMPKAAIDSGCIDVVVPLPLISDKIIHVLKQGKSRPPRADN